MSSIHQQPTRAAGKTVGSHRYIHYSARTDLTEKDDELVRAAEEISELTEESDYNVIRISSRRKTVSFLFYEEFFDDPFPALKASCLVDLAAGAVKKRDYAMVENPPILHRKELLLKAEHPVVSECSELTKLLEDAGMFFDSQRIGTKSLWENRLREAGLGWILEKPEIRSVELDRHINNRTEVVRHRTAISRVTLSKPFQCLERHGFLDSSYSIFDYGCGKGDDLRGLEQLGIQGAGWDPHFRPKSKKVTAGIVNLGYVINVIEDPLERIETVEKAYVLAQTLLVVSAQLISERNPQHRSYRDGVITSRDTFQKYYSHTELQEFIVECLDEKPIAVATGIYFVFKDKIAEQTFLEKRQRSMAISKPRVLIPRPTQTEKRAALYQRHEDLLEKLWQTWVGLGRTPFPDEVEEIIKPLEAGFGTLKRALRFLVEVKGDERITEAANVRMDDLLVYFALNLFQGRPRYSQQPLRLQRDVKLLFRNHTNALEQAKQLLFSVSDPEIILKACQESAERGIGYLNEEHSLTVHTSRINDLGSELRLYVGCASHLYGDIETADLIKIHVRSGKLSVMVYEGFDEEPLPKLMERIKIKLREQDIDYFDYGYNYAPPYLYWKSRFMDPSLPHYSDQVGFEEQIEKAGLIRQGEKQPTVMEFDTEVRERNLQINGYQLVLRGIPENLDQKCGQYFTFRDLIECGDTRSELKLENLPEQTATYSALHDLAVTVLDPVIDYFGMIKLTYGFCSAALSKKITSGIAPSLDQHSSCEVKATGKPICDRLGAAVDFIVEDEDMYEVATWVIQNTKFDRLYYYGADRPIHISVGPDNGQSTVILRTNRSGRRIPRAVTKEQFLAASDGQLDQKIP